MASELSKAEYEKKALAVTHKVAVKLAKLRAMENKIIGSSVKELKNDDPIKKELLSTLRTISFAISGLEFIKPRNFENDPITPKEIKNMPGQSVFRVNKSIRANENEEIQKRLKSFDDKYNLADMRKSINEKIKIHKEKMDAQLQAEDSAVTLLFGVKFNTKERSCAITSSHVTTPTHETKSAQEIDKVKPRGRG